MHVLYYGDTKPHSGIYKAARMEKEEVKRWCGHQASLETNLVIVGAKAPDEIGKGEDQVLGYMGKSDASHQRHR